jgi:mevalonate kinase
VSAGASAGPARGFGHGKIILVGEHAVVHGHAAIAAGISVGVTALASPGAGRLEVPAWRLVAAADDGGAVGRALAAVLDRFGARGFDFAADAGIPSRAGVGSSAALAVALARAAAAATGRDDAGLIAAAVHDAESVFHGTPSGIDAAAATTGAVGRFTRAGGWQPIKVLQTMTICVGLTGRPRDTSAQVAAVGRLRERLPAADGVLALMGRLADDAQAALACGDVDGLGRIFDAAHGLLAALRVSSPELDALVHDARAAGAVGAKLTGAGGGGAVIALAPGHERDVLARWRAAGFEGFLAEIACTETFRGGVGAAP